MWEIYRIKNKIIYDNIYIYYCIYTDLDRMIDIDR